jgi:two-component system cell cycle sensor histidine kinase/response regulator CckA
MTTTKEPTVGKILVVDDEIELKDALVDSLAAQSYEVRGYNSGSEALEVLRNEDFDLLITDLKMPEMDGIALIEAALAIDPHLVAIVMTGQGTIQTAIEAMKAGAFDFVLKPFRLETLLPVLTRAINTRRLRQENLQLRETVAIYELAQTIAFTLDPQTLISKLADAALQQTEADEVSILLPVNGGGDLYVAAVRGENRQRLLGERVPLEESISGWVARSREPLLLDGEVNDERFCSLWPRPGIRSAISVPMQVANKLVGVINLNVLDQPRSFNLGQMKALTILANTAAAALESASLYTQVLQAEENYRSIFENAIEGLFQSTPDGVFLTVNPAFAQMMGYESPAQMVDDITDIAKQVYVHPADRVEAALVEQRRGFLQDFEFEAYRKDGEKIWLSLNRRSARSKDSLEIHSEGSVENITERKRIEVEQHESQRQYESLVRSKEESLALLDTLLSTAPIGFAFHTPDLVYERINESLAAINGLTVEEHLGHTLGEVLPEMAKVLEPIMLRALSSGEPVLDFELSGETPAVPGRQRHWLVNFYPVRMQAGEILGVGVLVSEITERKQLEDQLRQSQKMEAVGQLAGGIAHDFNNLLTAITGYSSLGLKHIDENHRIRGYLEEIKKAGDRAANLTRQLLAFSRKQILQPVPLNLNDVVSDINKLLQRLIGEDILLSVKLGSDLRRIKVDPGQIEQVLVNLAVNARDAMPGGGKLTIETSNSELSQEDASRHMGLQVGRYVTLAVSDNGIGMDKVTEERIFEPFFTTKAKDKGTGLGLSTVYGIVKQSGGHISVNSEVGQGTTFKIYLPEHTAPETAEAEADPETSWRGSETVLLVEDEDVVRGLTRQILEQEGYSVLEASRGEEALSLCAAYEKPIQLLLTDVVMPETSGKEVADRLRTLRPEIKVLFMSGYTDEAIVHHGVLDATVELILKPFTPVALAKKVREVIDSNGTRGS